MSEATAVKDTDPSMDGTAAVLHSAPSCLAECLVVVVDTSGRDNARASGEFVVVCVAGNDDEDRFHKTRPVVLQSPTSVPSTVDTIMISGEADPSLLARSPASPRDSKLGGYSKTRSTPVDASTSLCAADEIEDSPQPTYCVESGVVRGGGRSLEWCSECSMVDCGSDEVD